MSNQEETNKRGLASASAETRERVAKAGGEAPHEKRGLQAAASETRQAVARKGGLARGEQRRKAKEAKESSEKDNSPQMSRTS
ncbi:MAG: hypothetical protein OK457_11190 [Thaumarchaeota archaeon]|nr:hypothetical protein [Nitrososphaerota archaeon]